MNWLRRLIVAWLVPEIDRQLGFLVEQSELQDWTKELRALRNELTNHQLLGR
jgi:hypothetical protein